MAFKIIPDKQGNNREFDKTKSLINNGITASLINREITQNKSN